MHRRSTDRDLLSAYAGAGDHAAFTELVTRYADFVYASALRQTGRRDQAEDVTQAVFILLSRKAERLKEGVVLPAWLHKATRYTALNAIKLENRRRMHERRAAAMVDGVRTDSPVFNKLAPDLDEGIAALPAKDRQAVILRFLRQQNLNEVANTLGISESAAQMRVSRAVERLRLFFRRRGVEISATTLAVVVLRHAAPAAAQPGVAIALRAVLPPHQLPVTAVRLATATSQSLAREKILCGLLVSAAAILLVAMTLAISHLVQPPSMPWQPIGASEPSALGASKNTRAFPDSIAKAIGFSA